MKMPLLLVEIHDYLDYKAHSEKELDKLFLRGQ
jgi:hypothetical protein